MRRGARGYSVLLMVAASFLSGELVAADWSYSFAIGYVYLREYFPNGNTYVREDGIRGTMGLESRPVTGELGSLTYRGTVYASLVRHRAEDPTRFTIPEGTEDSVYLGQLGTKHQLRWTPWNGLRSSLVSPYFGAAFDVWYRALNYYEIWLVPSVEIGITFRDVLCGSCQLQLGAVRPVGARNYVETTHAPWNANQNTTLRLDDQWSPVVSLVIPLSEGQLRVGFDGYRFGQSAPVQLTGPLFIFQPKTDIYSVYVAWEQRF